MMTNCTGCVYNKGYCSLPRMLDCPVKEKDMKPKLSFENSLRIIEQNSKINDIIRDSIFHGMYEAELEAIHDVNKAVYEFAEAQGVSIWDICFHFVPQVNYSGFDIDNSDPHNVKYVSKGSIKLAPVEFELEKGPDYWEVAYLQLISKIRMILDSEKK